VHNQNNRITSAHILKRTRGGRLTEKDHTKENEPSQESFFRNRPRERKRTQNHTRGDEPSQESCFKNRPGTNEHMKRSIKESKREK
jgi:hypothetical protein